MAWYADIIVDISLEKLDKTFQYLVPQELESQIQIGMLVEIPFGRGDRRTTGYVVELSEEPCFDVARIKPLLGIKQGSITLEAELIALAAYIRKNYGGTMNQALKTVLPVKMKENIKEKKTVCLCMEPEAAKQRFAECNRKNSVARERLLEALLQQHEIPQDILTGKLGITTPVIKALEEQGIIEVRIERDYRNPLRNLKVQGEQITLNPAQQNVVNQVLQDRAGGRYGTYVLHGVTGSGKTEVYMELIAQVVAEGKQAIVLIPEIALTYQTVMRFYRRFGERVSIMNSKMSPGERFDQFEKAKAGEIDIIIGPRSALFTPFSSIGMIIIDEEHENTYKSEQVPRYHAVGVARERARVHGASVILGSATPSLDSYYRMKQGEYELLTLAERVSDRELPHCHIVDLRQELRNGNRSILSHKLQDLMEDRLNKGQQIMLFINRRGLAGFISCRECGHVIKCPHCDVSLSQHRGGKMVCHYCGYTETEPIRCPECNSKYIGGFKAGTQKIEELVQQRFPKAKTLRMDMDTTRGKDSYEQILSAFSNQEANVLIGTQMIVKGHDFPNVTLVGVLAADMSLFAQDYHSAERTFQLLTQAAGRAGRGEEAGEVVIQTYSPKHYSIETACEQNYHSFYEQEIAYRDLLHYPPVWNMMVMIVSSRYEEDAENVAKQLKEAVDAMGYRMVMTVGPSVPSVSKIKDIYRRLVYLKAQDYEELVQIKDVLEKQLLEQKYGKEVNVQFDFNPIQGF